MPLLSERVARCLDASLRWSRSVAAPWLAARRRVSSHAAILLVAAVAFAAGLVGLGQRSDPPAELTYLTPPASSIPQTTSANEGEEEAAAATSPPAVLEEFAFRTHEVVPGDTLGGIAEKYGGDKQNLLWNKPDMTANPVLLHIGNNIMLPGRVCNR